MAGVPPGAPGFVSGGVSGLAGAVAVAASSPADAVLSGWPAAVSGVWGMTWRPETALRTPFGMGNTSGGSARFVSLTMLGADAVFGSDLVAPVLPVTDGPWVVGYGLNGVGAAPNAPRTVSGGPVILAQVLSDLQASNGEGTNDRDPAYTVASTYRDLAAAYRALYEQTGASDKYLLGKANYCEQQYEQILHKFTVTEAQLDDVTREVLSLQREEDEYQRLEGLRESQGLAALDVARKLKEKREEDAERGLLREVQGFFWDGPVNTVTGLWSTVTDIPGTLQGLWYGLTNPDKLWEEIVKDFDKPGGKGRAAFDLATLFLPVGKSKQATRLAELSRAMRIAAEGERLLQKALRLVATAEKAGRTTEAVQRLTKLVAIRQALADIQWGDYLRLLGKDALGAPYPGASSPRRAT